MKPKRFSALEVSQLLDDFHCVANDHAIALAQDPFFLTCRLCQSQRVYVEREHLVVCPNCGHSEYTLSEEAKPYEHGQYAKPIPTSLYTRGSNFIKLLTEFKGRENYN